MAGLLGRFFGRTVGEGAGVAIGTASARGVEPALEQFGNTMREHFHHTALRAEDAAALRARETLPDYPGIDLKGVDPEKEAGYNGIRPLRFDALTELQREHPSVGELITLRRRRLALGGDHGISQDEFREWLRRAGFTRAVIDALTKLLTTFLPPEVIANAVQQGFVPDDGILPGGDLHGGPYTVPAELVNIDPSDEAAVSGVDKDRLTVLAQLSGNPPGPQELLEMWRREIITEGDVERGIREGRTKTKWTKAIKALKAMLLPASVLVNLRLRGYIEDLEFHNRMELHGYNAAQANDWFLASGRPLAPQQMLDLIARKGPSPTGGVFDFQDFDKGMVESDIKPKYATPAHALYYKYPPLFQLRRAVESGGISRTRAAEIMHIERYEPADIQSLLDSWTVGSGTTAKGLTVTDLANEYEARWISRPQYVSGLKQLGYSDATANTKADAEDSKRTRKARDETIGLIRAQYVSHKIGRDRAVGELDAAGAPARVRDSMMVEWDRQRALTPDAMTPAQIKKAWYQVRMTRAEAVARLEFKGYDAADAEIYLDE